MIHTCLRAVTESTYSRIPASNDSTKGTPVAQAYKIELASGVLVSNTIRFIKNITMDDFVEFVGQVCTHDAMICVLGVTCLVGIPLFGK